jgi:hypothetical protein
MRIPEGADFDPADEGNHFSSVFVFHQASRSLHVDDTIVYHEDPHFLLRCAGAHKGKMSFWVGVEKGLKKTKEAPTQFHNFIEGILNDWDFDNVIAAHGGNKIGGAKEAVRETLRRSTKALERMENEASSSGGEAESRK